MEKNPVTPAARIGSSRWNRVGRARGSVLAAVSARSIKADKKTQTTKQHMKSATQWRWNNLELAAVGIFRNQKTNRTQTSRPSLAGWLAGAGLWLAVSVQAQPTGPETALSFDGTNHFVTVSAGVIPSSGSFTVECWVNAAATPNQMQMVSSGAPGGGGGNTFALGKSGSGTVQVTFGSGGGSVWDTGITLPGGWHHLALVKGSSDTFFYLDGLLKTNRGSAITPPNGSQFRIGRNRGNLTDHWQGMMDEVRVWNTGRSATEITNAARRAIPGNASGLVGYWRMDDGTGGTVTDSSPSGLSGSLSGVPVWVSSGALFEPVALSASASNITPDSVTFHGALRPNNGATTAWFEWGSSTNYGQSSAPAGAGACNCTNFIAIPVSGLPAASALHFRLVASNASGLSLGGDNLFSTPAIPVQAFTSNALSITETGAVLHGWVSQGTTPLTAWFEYGLTTNYGSLTASTNFNTPTELSATLTGLTKGRQYHWRLVATNAAGRSNGEDAVFITPYSAVVVNINASGPGSMRAVIDEVNASAAPTNFVRFEIPGPGPHAVAGTNMFFGVNQTVILDGATQPGYSGYPLVDLSGAGLGIGGANSLIRGLVLNLSNQTALTLSSSASNSVVESCFIGVDSSGNTALGTATGLIISGRGCRIGGTQPGSGNLISGCWLNALNIRANQVQVFGNRFGTDVMGALALPNRWAIRLFLYTTNCQIGGTGAGEANLIANSQLEGIQVASGHGHTLRGNSFINNGSLAINLVSSFGELPEMNDPGDGDTGPNNLQNYPVLLAVTNLGTNLFIAGRLSSGTNSTYTLDFYGSPTAGALGFGEGQHYLGAISVTTDGAGEVSFLAGFPITVSSNSVVSVSATATDAGGSTSEFSVARRDTRTLDCSGLGITAPGLPPGTNRAPYSFVLLATNAASPQVYAVTGGSLPPGLGLSTTGRLSGTPTNLGEFAFTITLVNGLGCAVSSNYSLSIGCPTISLSSLQRSNGLINSSFSEFINVAGGVAPITFAVTDGALPQGLSLGTQGLLFGLASQTGDVEFTVTATDALGCMGSRNYQMDISCSTNPITTAVPGPAVRGASYAQFFTNPAVQSFSITAGTVPPGLTLESVGPGIAVLTGTPGATGAYAFTVSGLLTNFLCTVRSNFSLSVSDLAFAIQPTNQNVLPGTNVTLTALAVAGGPLAYQWRFAGTNLPGATNASHTFTNANLAEHHGLFSCQAVAGEYSAISSNALVYVLVRPGYVVGLATNLSALQGSTFTLSVVVTGAPPIWYRWIRGGVAIATSAVPFLTITNYQMPNASANSFRVGATNVAAPAGVFSPSIGNVTVTMIPDFDGDGLGDPWEEAFFGSSSTNSNANALLDPDGDGMTNLDEYRAGTDPTNAFSVLKILLSTTNGAPLQFVAQSNVSYSVQWRTNLFAGTWANLTGLLAQPLVRTVEVDTALAPAGAERYFRIITPLVP
jgi:Concanavalin A-like lectin/glucanases superfamily/Putative Ig domain